MFLHLTTLLNLDQDPIATVDAQFVGGAFGNTFMVVATDPDRTGGMVALHTYGPFATADDAHVWAAAHIASYSAWAVAPLAAPYTNAEGNAGRRKPITHSTTARAARANTIATYLKPHRLTRLRYGTRRDTTRQGFTARELDHPELGPVVELTALGPDAYQRDRDHHLMHTVLRHDHARYEVTDHHTHLLVRRLSDAELHAAADRAAARVTPHLAALTANTPPATEAAHTLFHAVLSEAREVASDDPDDSDLMLQVQDMAPHDALTALKKAFLPSDLIEPIADALALLAPDTYTPTTG
ncbi:hypothetical protein [Streptomyces sp. NPDC007088]|uniref:hypothetical protein n=1 Tax=Streptomyces sp. NPDC007088 TaxID=3364773 RepID=UPI003695F5D5